MTNGVPNGNSALVDIGDFPFLQKIGGGYFVTQNTNLVNGGNFPVLDSIGGYFFIRNNDKLENVGTFPRLKDIGTYVSIRSNGNLRYLYDFPALTSIGDGRAWVPSSNSGRGSALNDVSIVVEGNTLLLYCCIFTKFTSGSTISIAASIHINDNLEGCNSASQAECGVVVSLDELSIFSTSLESSFTLISNSRWRLNKPNSGFDWITTFSDGTMNVTDSLTGGNNDSITSTLITINYDQSSRSEESLTASLFIYSLDASDVATPADTLTVVIRMANPLYSGNIVVDDQADVDVLSASGAPFAEGNTIHMIQGNVVISGSVTDLSIFNNIDTITGYLRAEGLTQLRALSQASGNGDYVGLTNLRMVGGYFIVGQGEVSSLIGSSNTSLDSVGYFPHLESIGSSFEIRNNTSLDAVGTFPVLRSIGGRFRLRDNNQLLYIPDFDSLVRIGQEITIEENDRLITVGSFPRLETIGGDLNFTNNGNLTMRGTYPVLRSIGNQFKVENCDRLKRINDFPSLTTIGSAFFVSRNDSLRGIGDFPVLTTIRGSLQIQSNPLLGYCCGFSRILLDESIVSGNTTIRNNAVGCDSESQINTPLTLISSNEIIAYDNTDSIAIDFTLGCGVTGWTSTITYTPTNSNFITLSSTGSTTQTGAITIMATPTENTGVERTVTITLTTTGSTGTADTTITIMQAAGPPTLTLSRTTANVDDMAQTLTVGVTLGGSAESWNVTETDDENFITISKVGDDSLRITILENSSTTDPREATLTFTTTGGTGEATQTLVITQLPRGLEPPTLMLSLTTADVDATAQMLTVGVTLGGSAEGWDVTVTDNEDFIDTLKVGDDSLRITISKNSSTASREATLTFTTEGADSQTLVITQAGGVPTLTIARDDSPELESEGGSEDIEVMSNTTWSVTTMASFIASLTFTPTEGGTPVTSFSGTLDGTGSGTLRIVYAANTEVARMAMIILTTGGTETVNITLTQAAAPPALEITTPSNAAGDTTVAYTATTDSDSVEDCVYGR